jgi:hypothetical protein
MNVDESGNYALNSDVFTANGRSTYNDVNLFADIYQDNFDPIKPFENLLSQNYRSCSDYDFKLIALLMAGTTYILVVTTYYPNEVGNFSIMVSGPNMITFDPFGEYFYYFGINKREIPDPKEITKPNLYFLLNGKLQMLLLILSR